MIALAFGAKTFKLKFGHRGVNHPVIDVKDRGVRITSQNHGFAVAEELPSELIVTERNLNDDTIEGLRHAELNVASVQYHPEANPGPHDSLPLFKRFEEMMKGAKTH
jgi:carbamoyl-phosphate synthase small subunit